MSLGERSEGRRSGLYLGTVVYNNDPEGRNRTKIRVPGVYDDDVPVEDLPWAEMCSAVFGNAHGPVKIPPVGQTVWVMFRQGHDEYPVLMGGQLIDKDSAQGNKMEAIEGGDAKVVSGKSEQISGARVRSTTGPEIHKTEGPANYEFSNLDFVVLDGVKYTYGSKAEVVEGRSSENVKGAKVLQVLGTQKIDVSGGRDETIGQDCRSFILGQMVATASGLMKSPTDPGILFTALNTMFKAESKTTVLEGSSLVLDPAGLQTTLKSLVSLLIDAGTLIRIGSGNTLPVALAPHTHISGSPGSPTGPVLPLPTYLSTKVVVE